MNSKGEPLCKVPLINLGGVGFSFFDDGGKEKKILRDITLEVCDIPDHPQVIGILGPSGMGKTTLLNLLSGARKPTVGRVEVYDAAKNALVEVEQGMVGVVTQNYRVFPQYTVQKNLLLAAAKKNGHTVKEQHDMVMDYLVRFGIADLASLYPKQLSGGQRQRVATIQQLLCSGHFILFDEPFSGLDPLMKEQAAAQINDSASMSELNTFLIITHDITQAVMSSDRLLILGRERTSAGEVIPGAYIKYTIDLAAEGLAWQPNITQLPKFSEVVSEVRGLFHQL